MGLRARWKALDGRIIEWITGTAMGKYTIMAANT
jgi:hypothetical protein